MIIALDYDDTFTADKELWTWFVERAKKSGHEVSFVTYRFSYRPKGYDNADIEEDAKVLGIPVVFTEGKQKSHVFKADIWIDDSPYMIAGYKQMKGMIAGCETQQDTEEKH